MINCELNSKRFFFDSYKSSLYPNQASFFNNDSSYSFTSKIKSEMTLVNTIDFNNKTNNFGSNFFFDYNSYLTYFYTVILFFYNIPFLFFDIGRNIFNLTNLISILFYHYDILVA